MSAGWEQSVHVGFKHDSNTPGAVMSDVYYTFEGSGSGLMTLGPIAMPMVTPPPPTGGQNVSASPPVPPNNWAPDSSEERTNVTIQPSSQPRHLDLSFSAARPDKQGTKSVQSNVMWKKVRF